jgi:protoheme IX farnesyltransferase
MAIAWLYREQYHLAGYQMLTNVEPTGRAAAWHALIPSLLLIPVSVAILEPTDALTWSLAAVGVFASLVLAIASLAFMRHRDMPSARLLLRSSLLYLPAILMLVAIRACL